MPVIPAGFCSFPVLLFVIDGECADLSGAAGQIRGKNSRALNCGEEFTEIILDYLMPV